MDKKYITAGYAFLFSLLLIVSSIYLSPVFGLINPWLFLPLAPLGYIIATQKDLNTTMLIIMGIVVFGFFERELSVHVEDWKFDFEGIGALYFVFPIFASTYLTYYIINIMQLSPNEFSETTTIVTAIVSILLISSIFKIVLILFTETIYGGVF